MNKFMIFVLRAILGLVFAVVLSRIFDHATRPLYVLGVACCLVGASYFLEYMRKRKS